MFIIVSLSHACAGVKANMPLFCVFIAEHDSGSGRRRAAMAVKKRLEKIEKYRSRLNEYLNKNFSLSELSMYGLEDLQFFQ